MCCLKVAHGALAIRTLHVGEFSAVLSGGELALGSKARKLVLKAAR